VNGISGDATAVLKMDVYAQIRLGLALSAVWYAGSAPKVDLASCRDLR
jgi:hypothetical protein